MRTSSGSFIEPGAIVRLPPNWKPYPHDEIKLNEKPPTKKTSKVPHTPSSYTIGIITDLDRIPRRLSVIALPDLPGDPKGIGTGGLPVRGFVLPNDDSFPIEVVPEMVEDEPDDPPPPYGRNILFAAISGAPSQSILSTDTLWRASIRFREFGLCGEPSCSGVYRIVDGHLAAQSDAKKKKEAVERESYRANLLRSLDELRSRKAMAKRVNDFKDVLELSDKIKRITSDMGLLKRQAGPQILWCPYCGWKPNF